MPGNKRPNKARNQTTGSTRGVDDAPWFAKAKQKARNKRKQKKRSQRANRGR